MQESTIGRFTSFNIRYSPCFAATESAIGKVSSNTATGLRSQTFVPNEINQLVLHESTDTFITASQSGHHTPDGFGILQGWSVFGQWALSINKHAEFCQPLLSHTFGFGSVCS
jgi:hypothetical protein